MIRVVGTLRNSGEPRQYYARLLGGAEAGSDQYRLADIDNNFAIPATRDEMPLDVFFEVDQDFKPHFVEYRRFARAPVPPAPADAAPEERVIGAVSAAAVGSGTVSGLRFLRAIVEDATGALTTVPFPLARSALSNAELSDGKLLSGRIHGSRRSLAGSGSDAVDEFALPEGARMFQLRCRVRTAESLAGRVFNFVNLVVNQYYVQSRMGQDYMLSGYYAIVDREGGDYLELFIAGPDNPAFRGMLDFQHIRTAELRRSSSVIGFIFYVRPGENIARIQNQVGANIEFKMPGYDVP